MDPSGHARGVLEYAKVLDAIAAEAQSAGGRARVRSLVPGADEPVVAAEQAMVAEVGRALQEGRAPWPLAVADDAGELLERAARGGTPLEPAELWRVAGSLETASTLRRRLDSQAENLPLVRASAAGLGTHDALVAAVASVIDPRGEVREDASPALRALRREFQREREALLARLEALLRATSAAPDPYVTLRGDRYVIPVRADSAGAVRGIVHDRSASGATLFVEPLEALDSNNELQRLRDAERREVRRILEELTRRVAGESDAARASLEAMERIDSVQARALWARAWNAAAPRIGPRLRLQRARHPLLEMQLGALGRTSVPLDLDPGAALALVVTGPNAGGKTVALKSVGLLALLHQAGIPIPAQADSELPVFARVHADIGDEQSIEAAESTFSSHVRHVVLAVRDAGPRTLVLLDELMAGTDPEEGAALAKVVLRRFVAAGATTLVTTHLAALKLFAHSEPGLGNAAMAFDRDSRMPLYRLQPGVPGSSNALATAARLGLDPELLEAARDERGDVAGRLEAALAALEAERMRLAASATESEAAAAEARRIREEHATALARLAATRREALAEAKREAAELAAGARARIEQAVRGVREAQASAESIRAAHSEVQELERRLDSLAERATPIPATDSAAIAPGDRAWVRALGREGIVERIDSGGRARVRFGNVTLSVAAHELQRLGPAAPAGPGPAGPAAAAGGYTAPETPPIPTRLDVRGHEREGALEAVTAFLDRLVLQGDHEALIVHGKGTGTLRRAVHEHLAHHPEVASFRLGEHGEGGSGVTIVTLR